MSSKDELYRQLVKEAKSANALLQRLRGHLGKDFGWAGKILTDRLSSKSVNMITEKGYIKYNKTLSVPQIKAGLKAISQFKASKTHTPEGVLSNIEETKKAIGESLSVDSKMAESIYEFFSTDKYNLSDEVKYEALQIALEIDRKGGNEEIYMDMIEDYIQYGNDENIKSELSSIFKMVQTGQLDLSKIKNMNVRM